MSNPLAGFCVVLVEPTLPENVGAVARAMNNFGIEDLRLINPCDYRNPAAERIAVHSQNVLREAQCFHSLENAVSRSNFVLGATVRRRGRRAVPIDLPDVCAHLPARRENAALVFGRESGGLTNRELSCCHLLVRIPAFGTTHSFNLAQAVALVLYELSRSAKRHEDNTAPAEELAAAEELEGLKLHLFAVLRLVGFLKEKQRETLWQSFSDLMARARMRSADVRLLRGFLRRTEWTVRHPKPGQTTTDKPAAGLCKQKRRTHSKR